MMIKLQKFPELHDRIVQRQLQKKQKMLYLIEKIKKNTFMSPEKRLQIYVHQ